jgi:hypothetical protein
MPFKADMNIKFFYTSFEPLKNKNLDEIVEGTRSFYPTAKIIEEWKI